MSTKERFGIVTGQTQEQRDAMECEADRMTALSRLFGEAYMRGRAQGRNDVRREEIRNGPGQTAKPGGAFDDGLAERLAQIGVQARNTSLREGNPGWAITAWEEHSKHEDKAFHAFVRAILTELAAMPVELPKDMLLPAGDATGAAHVVLDMVRPILAAKEATNRILADSVHAASITVEQQAQRIAELEKRLAEQTMRADNFVRAAEQEAFRKHDGMPVDATGKTPGQVLKSAIAQALADGEPYEKQAEIGAQAVLRAFGQNAAEALQRVRERVKSGFDAANAVDDERAKLEGLKP